MTLPSLKNFSVTPLRTEYSSHSLVLQQDCPNSNYYHNPNVVNQTWTQVLQLCGSAGCISQLHQNKVSFPVHGHQTLMRYPFSPSISNAYSHNYIAFYQDLAFYLCASALFSNPLAHWSKDLLCLSFAFSRHSHFSNWVFDKD